MAIKRLFMCNILSCKYHFRSGKEANFVNGQYATDAEDEIAELEAEVKQRHPHIYINKDLVEIDVDASPIQTLRAKIEAEMREKIMAEMGAKNAEATAPSGAEVMNKLAALRTGGIATTATVAGVTAESNGAGSKN